MIRHKTKIKNFEELATTALRKDALSVAEAGLLAIDTKEVIRQNVRFLRDNIVIAGKRLKMRSDGGLYVVAIGKCALDAAQELEKILTDRISGGVVLDIRPGKLRYMEAHTGTHPFPSEKNAKATERILSFLKGRTRDDIVLFVVSGGGSTLLCAPSGMTFRDEANAVKKLFETGANIQELNILRKHLSRARGGNLAAAAYPARTVSLLFSDVPGFPQEAIASGPTMRDATDISDAIGILDKYGLTDCFPKLKDSLLETPKDKGIFKNVRNVCVVSGEIALRAMQKEAVRRGYSAKILPLELSGIAQDIGKKIARAIRKARPGTALLCGGESTVRVARGGKGGRNLEVALSALRDIMPETILVTIASDGRDNTEFAGAVCDILTKEKVARLSLDPAKYLASSNSYRFFRKAGNFLVTGPTGSNVSDLAVALHGIQKTRRRT